MNLSTSKVLVTGGAGFIGSHIVDDLLDSGARVRVIDNFSSGHMDNLSHIKNQIEIIEGDILNIDDLSNAASGVDAISHQAAQLEIIKCIDDPVEDLRSNTIGTLNVLEVARRLDIPKVVFASSACVYGQACYVPQDEAHPTMPNWPYGVSKLAAENYARLYSDYYGIDTIGLRYSIVYGAREWYGRVLTAFLRRALDGKPPVVWGGEQERDFIHVNDVVRFHNQCLVKDTWNTPIYNVSTGKSTSIKQLANLVCKLFNLPEFIYEGINEGESSELVEGRIRLPAELKRMVLDNTAAMREMDWEPQVPLDQGIILEMEWLEKYPKRWLVMQY